MCLGMRACVYIALLQHYELCVQELKENDIKLENVRICYSPFSRTRHTAEVVASVLNLPFEGPQCKVIYTHPQRDPFLGE